MDEARRPLRATKRRGVDIALDAGYARTVHFARFFRRETGFPPNDYRTSKVGAAVR